MAGHKVSITGIVACMLLLASAQRGEARPEERGGLDKPKRLEAPNEKRRNAPGRLMRRGRRFFGPLRRIFDADHDGRLSQEERRRLREVLRKFRRRMRARFDEDGDGKLSQEEKEKMREEMKLRREKLRRLRLEKFDTDGDGRLSPEERWPLREARRKALERIKALLDLDGDGTITPGEVESAVEKGVPDFRSIFQEELEKCSAGTKGKKPSAK